jgi:hypothetical protein
MARNLREPVAAARVWLAARREALAAATKLQARECACRALAILARACVRDDGTANIAVDRGEEWPLSAG